MKHANNLKIISLHSIAVDKGCVSLMLIAREDYYLDVDVINII